MERSLRLFRNSFNLVRSFSASATSATTSSSSSAPTSVSKKPKRKKKKNLIEVAQFLPNWGIGYQMAKTHWTGVSYQIIKINLYKDGRHGELFTKMGCHLQSCRCSQENKWGSQALLEVHRKLKETHREHTKTRSSSGLIRCLWVCEVSLDQCDVFQIQWRSGAPHALLWKLEQDIGVPCFVEVAS